MIIYGIDKTRYYDKNGVELKDGDTIRWDSGKVEKLYLTESGDLGTDATNPVWIERDWAVPCQYGIYPLLEEDTMEIVKV